MSLEDLAPRVRADQVARTRSASSTGTSDVVARPTRSASGTSISRQPLAERVADAAPPARGRSRGVPRAAHQLVGRAAPRQLLRVADDALQRSARRSRGRVRDVVGWRAPSARARPRADSRASRHQRLRAAQVLARSPAARDEHEPLHPRREARSPARRRRSRPSSCRPRPADSIPSSSQQRGGPARVALDRDRPRAASPSSRSRAGPAPPRGGRAHELRHVHSQFCQDAAEAVDEQRSAGPSPSSSITLTSRPSISSGAASRRPVDVEPRRASPSA